MEAQAAYLFLPGPNGREPCNLKKICILHARVFVMNVFLFFNENFN